MNSNTFVDIVVDWRFCWEQSQTAVTSRDTLTRTQSGNYMTWFDITSEYTEIDFEHILDLTVYSGCIHLFLLGNP